jgi:hypothetical protein
MIYTANVLKFVNLQSEEFMKEEQIKKAVEKSIEEMCEVFKENPHWFWKEEDVQSYLYALMKDRSEFYEETKSNKKIFLVHREYKTKSWVNHLLHRLVQREGKGEFDLVVWDPNNDWNKLWSPEFKVLCGIEIKFPTSFSDNGDSKLELGSLARQIKKDHAKLIEPTNEVKNKYLLIFLKNSGFTEEEFSKTIHLSGVNIKHTMAIVEGTKNAQHR